MHTPELSPERLFVLQFSVYIILVSSLTICFIKSYAYDKKSEINVVISSLYQYGLFDQAINEKGNTLYVLSGFAKALKDNSLNFDDGLQGRVRILTYEQIPPLNIAEPATYNDIASTLNNDDDLFINGNGWN